MVTRADHDEGGQVESHWPKIDIPMLFPDMARGSGGAGAAANMRFEIGRPFLRNRAES